MRLIDADALNGLKFVAIKGDKVEEAYRSGWNDAIECIIENAPSANRPSAEWVREDKLISTLTDDVKEWEVNYTLYATHWKCSNCGAEPYYERDIKAEHHYCPNCGADMRGENDG